MRWTAPCAPWLPLTRWGIQRARRAPCQGVRCLLLPAERVIGACMGPLTAWLQRGKDGCCLSEQYA